MTAKQEEAIRIIQILDDETLSALLDQMRKLQKERLKEYRKNHPADFDGFVSKYDRGMSADDYVRTLRDNDRI